MAHALDTAYDHGPRHSMFTAGLAPNGQPLTQAGSGPALKIITCGSVDDGKSTLIGRFLWDMQLVHDDRRTAVMDAATASNQAPDFSSLFDGLIAEREQGITIDVCWHYHDTPQGRIVLIDSPGHEQYSRNMATGASHADIAVLVLDARSGVKRQTLRHLAILDLAGVRTIAIAVNKMDLVDWDRARFDEVKAECARALLHFPAIAWSAIPVAALSGDNVVNRSTSMPWYEGPTFADLLAQGTSKPDAIHPFALPVQAVLRDGQDFRGAAGTIASGSVRPGDTVLSVLTGRQSRVRQVFKPDRPAADAHEGSAVTIVLDDDLDISRGDVLAAPGTSLRAASRFSARLVWLNDTASDTAVNCLLQTGNDLVPVSGLTVEGRLDLETLDRHAAVTCGPNDLADVQVELARPVVLDAFSTTAKAGTFLLIDALSGGVLAGGTVTQVQDAESRTDTIAFVIDRARLDRGLCADLGDDAASQAEYRRRATEAAILLRSAGVEVVIKI
jgi:bifunctional enzyme CysN/CysC